VDNIDDVMVEDWQGLESELERLFMVYGYPVDDLQDSNDQDNYEDKTSEETIISKSGVPPLSR